MRDVDWTGVGRGVVGAVGRAVDGLKAEEKGK